MYKYEELYEECFIQKVSKDSNLPSLLAIGRGICEVVDGLNLLDGVATLASPEWSGGLPLEDTVCGFCLTKTSAGTVKEELISLLWSSTLSV